MGACCGCLIPANQLMGARLQADGINVIPNVRLNGRESVPYALAGIPSRSTLAL